MLWIWVLLGCGKPAPTDVPTPSDVPAPTEASGACAPADPATWEACAGKEITVEVTPATDILQTPMLSGPDQEQGYFEVGGTSLIVLASVSMGCEPPISVTGTLRLVDLGGPDGTKMEWRGWVLDATAVRCR